MSASGYQAVMARKAAILQDATGIDYDQLSRGPLAFDYEGLMASVPYTWEEIRAIQAGTGVGGTPFYRLDNLTELVRRISNAGKGAQILIKDEAVNPSGSFKDRRASVSAHHARAAGYPGIVAATSGNYGAAVASQAAMHRLAAIVIQEVYDSRERGQPEILEKGRKCEIYGAEVLQTTVGPELFYLLLRTLEETGYFNASLYTPFSIMGIETLGWEIASDTRRLAGRDPDLVLVTHAGGGHVTGVARGLRRAGATSSQVVGVSVDLSGLHMASDHDFNRKSFTTGHTGFSFPFTGWPDRVDVPKNAARPLRYLDRFITVTQGEVFMATELLSRIEGLERGPAGNTSLAAAIALARTRAQDELVVVCETEYTGAGKSPVAQLEFAASLGIEIVVGNRADDQPGGRIVIPSSIEAMAFSEVDLDRIRASYLRRAAELVGRAFSREEEDFLTEDIRAETGEIDRMVAGL